MYLELIKILSVASAAADAALKAKQVYQTLRESAQQSQQLTPEQSKELDDRAAAIEASEANKPSGR